MKEKNYNIKMQMKRIEKKLEEKTLDPRIENTKECQMVDVEH